MISQHAHQAVSRPTSSDEFPGPLRHPPLSYEEACARHLPEIERHLEESRIASGLVLEMIDYHLQTGGKRMRAILPVWACENLGGDPEAALDLGVGLELLHNATLVHDDLQDGDTHRRGRATVWFKWGMAQAINAGDALIFEAFTRIARSPVASRVLATISKAAVRVVEGQALDLQQQGAGDAAWAEPPTLEEWVEMACRKTGALFALCMSTGAAAARRSDAFIEIASRYGEDIGLLFQIQDDLLDLVGDKGRERSGADLMEGKLSFPAVWAFENASPSAVAPLSAILSRPRQERTWPMADEAIAALKRCGALDATAAHLMRAKATLEAHPLAGVVPGLIERCLAPIAHALEPASTAVATAEEP